MNKLLFLFFMFPLLAFGQTFNWEQIDPIPATVRITTPVDSDFILIQKIHGVKRHVSFSDFKVSLKLADIWTPASTQDALAGVDNTKPLTSKSSSEANTIIYVPYVDQKRDIQLSVNLIDKLGDTIVGNNQPFNYIDFDTTLTDIERKRARLYYDKEKDNLVFYDANKDVSLDIGKEGWLDVYNNSGVTILNGSCVVFEGNGGSRPSIKLAQANLPVNMSSRLGVATHDIEAGTIGRMTIWGEVRDYNTSGMSTGQKLFLSPFVAGDLINTKPSFPNTTILIATVDSVGVNGSINVNVIGDPSRILGNINNGCFIESFTFSVTSDGTTIKGDLVNKSGDNHLIMMFSDGLDTLDLTNPREINLIEGADDNPQLQYVYIDESTRTLAVSTSYWSASEHIPVAEVVTQSASNVQNYGAIRNRNINNHVADNNGMGGLDHIRKRIRSLYCEWESGVTVSVSGDNITTTGGQAWQMHLQGYDAWDLSTDNAFLPNSPIQNYRVIDELTDITTDASGGTLKNKEYSIVLIGIQNSGDDPDQMLINMPTGTYNNVSDAILDEQKYTVFNIPRLFRGVGFLVARLVFSNAGGTWNLEYTEDLRGSIPSNIASNGGTGGTGYTAFLQLDDTPSAFTGSGGSFVTVGSAENALDFTHKSDVLLTGLDSSGFRVDTSQVNGLTVFRSDIIAIEAEQVVQNNAITATETDIAKLQDTANIHLGRINDNETDIDNHINNLLNPHDVRASQIIDFDTEVGNNASVVNNTAKVSANDPTITFQGTAISGSETLTLNQSAAKTIIINDTQAAAQTISRAGTDVTLSDGGGAVSIADNDNSSTNEIQDISGIGINASDIDDLETDQIVQNSAIGLNTTHRETVTDNPHAVTATNVGLGNVENAAASGLYEPILSKNTGFNKNFGSTTGTVLEGRTFGTAANSNTGDFEVPLTFSTGLLRVGNTITNTLDISGIAQNESDINDLELEQITQNLAISLNTGKDTAGIYHNNRQVLDLVENINTGDQDISGIAINTDSIIANAADIDNLTLSQRETATTQFALAGVDDEKILTAKAFSEALAIILSSYSGISKYQDFVESDTKATGDVHTLDYTPEANTVQIIYNNKPLSSEAYTVSGNTVQVNQYVNKFDQLRITYVKQF